MKQILLVALMSVSFGAMAQSASSTTSNSGPSTQTTTSTTTSTATANNSGSGNGNNVTFTSPGDTTSKIDQTVNGKTEQVVSGGTNSSVHQTFGSQTIRNTPSVSAAPLVSSNDTCMGSASGAVNVPGFGLGVGKTYVDDNCVMLKNSRELWNMGMKAAAMALMCNDSKNREALEITGFECPQTTRDRERRASVPANSAQAAVSRGEPTDPIVRARLGLPAIKE